MFSNITNQFTSLVGAVKGGQSEEEAGATTTTNQPEIVTTAATTAQQQQQQHHEVPVAPETTAEAGAECDESKSGWLGSAKGWLGSASIPSMPAMPSMPSMPSMPAMPSMPTIPSIPGLRKGNNEADAAAATEGTNNVNINAPASNVGNVPATLGVEDDDKSRYISATEGADSHPASGGGTPTNDEGQIGQVTTKVTQQAKHFGSFLTSAISKAGTKITETVKSNPILESFNKEQEAFIKGQAGSINQGMAPWVGHPNEAKIKEEILGLSQDRRNFVRAPPAGVDFDFNYDTAYSTAVAIMAEDKALETMRFELVPKIITEENFWRNYFYRVSLIIQAAELGTLGEDGVAQASSGEDEEQWEKELEAELKDYEVVAQVAAAGVSTSFTTKTKNQNVKTAATGGATTTTTTSSSSSSSSSSSLATKSKTTTTVKPSSTTATTTKATTATRTSANNAAEGGIAVTAHNDNAAGGDALPAIANLRVRSTTNEWEEYADLIEDTDDLKTLKNLKRVMLGYP